MLKDRYNATKNTRTDEYDTPHTALANLERERMTVVLQQHSTSSSDLPHNSKMVVLHINMRVVHGIKSVERVERH